MTTVKDQEKHAAAAKIKEKYDNARTHFANMQILIDEAARFDNERKQWDEEGRVYNSRSPDSINPATVLTTQTATTENPTKSEDTPDFHGPADEYQQFFQYVYSAVTNAVQAPAQQAAWQQAFAALGPQSFQNGISYSNQMAAQGPVQFNLAPQANQPLQNEPVNANQADNIVSNQHNDHHQHAAAPRAVLHPAGEQKDQEEKYFDFEYDDTDELDTNFTEGLGHLIDVANRSGEESAQRAVFFIYYQKSAVLDIIKQLNKTVQCANSAEQVASSFSKSVYQIFNRPNFKMICKNARDLNVYTENNKARVNSKIANSPSLNYRTP